MLPGPFAVGVDPGGRHTGVVARAGDQLLYKALVSCTPDITFDWYLAEVVDTVRRARDHARDVLIAHDTHPRTGLLVGVEDINDPTPQMGIASIRGLIDTAQVLGAVAAHFVVTRIPPAGHGSNPLSTYPNALVGHETEGRGRLRHVRSAWDIAGVTHRIHQLTTTTQPGRRP